MKRSCLLLTPLILGFAVFFASPGNLHAAEPASAANVDSYRQFLDKLDVKDWKSIAAARTELEKRFSKAPDSVAVEAFRTFRTFYSQTVQTIDRAYFWQMATNRTLRKDFQAALNEIMSGGPGYITVLTPEVLNNDPIQTLDKKDDAFRKRMEEKYGVTLKDLRELRACGIRFSWGEGDWYAGEDAAYLAKAGAFLKGDYRDFLTFQAETAQERIAEDAALMISWDELRQRIIRQEAFEKDHPALGKTEKDLDLSRLMSIYIGGMDNTRAYDLNFMNPGRSPGTGEIDPELRKSYERFLVENKTSSFHPLIAKVCDILKRNDYKYSKELDTYLKEQGYGMFLFMYQGNGK